jgi:hypothetical protein
VRLLSDFNLEIDGISDLSESLTRAIRKYPDLAEKRLRQQANNFRKDVVAKEKEVIKDDNVRVKNKLTTNQGFQIGKTHGYNENMEVDFSAKSKIFHLVENGHEQVNQDGQTIGWVEGNHVVKKMRDGYENFVIPFEMDKLLKDIVKECGLD